MKQLLIILFFISMSCQLVAQTYFNRDYDIATQINSFTSVATLQDSLYVGLGNVSYSDRSQLSFVKINSEGDTILTNNIGVANDIYYSGEIALWGDTIYAVGGYKHTVDMDTSKALLVKADSNGDTLWTKLYGGANYAHFNALAIEDNGDIVMTGWIAAPGASASDIYVVKVDSAGSIIWEKQYGGTEQDEAKSVLNTNDNGYLVCGNTKSFGQGGQDFYLLKLDSIGQVVWDTAFGSVNNDGGRAIYSFDESIIVNGMIKNDLSFDGQGYIAKFSSSGNLIWEQTYGNEYYNEFVDAIETEDGGVLSIGFYKNGEGTNQPLGWLVKTSSTGDSLWQRTFKIRDNDHYFRDIKQTNDGGFVMAGFVFPDGTGNTQDMWLVKVDSMGCDVAKCVTGINENVKVESGNLKLYPNPAQEHLTVETSLLNYDNVHIEIYDLQGKLLDRKVIAQAVSILDISNLYKGVYVCKLLADGEQLSTERIVKL